MGTSMDTAEPRATSRMITAMARPILSAFWEIVLVGGLRASITAPPMRTCRPAAVAGTTAAWSWSSVS